jgi:hypothetical protein
VKIHPRRKKISEELNMSQKLNVLRACLFAGALSFSAGFASSALASDPLPGDDVAPPVNVNIALVYNQFNDAGALGAVHGDTYSKDTHISTDISVLRYIRTFEINGVEAGVQAYEPYVAFLGQQTLGVSNIPSAAPGLLPAYGAGRANLSASSGFGQPNLGAFFFPINDPATGTYLVIAPWISPPISSYNKNSNLNAGSNQFVYEMEVGFRKILFGTPTTRNLTISMWGEIYGFGNNNHAGDVSPSVSANNIPAIYTFAHNFINPAIPDANPLRTASTAGATLREQSSEEFRVYLPYQFFPATAAFIAPGFYQSFGGKQTYKLHGSGAVIDSGNRTNESQLRLVAGTFVSTSMQVLLVGGYDIANHGGPLNRSFEIRIAKFF